MVFQEPMTSLNPSMTIGRQMEEALILHRKHDSRTRMAMMSDMLKRIGINDVNSALAAYPHEFSGGMRQRIMLASVMLLKPRLLIADEPTTALDAIVQRDVMDLMVSLARDNGTSILLISHDLPLVSRYCDRIVVMHQGHMVESGDARSVLERPSKPYTKNLVASLPKRGTERRPVAQGNVLVSVKDLVVEYQRRRGIFGAGTINRAVDGVSFDVREGEILAVVGGSGSGKTTLARVLGGLKEETAGEIRFSGKAVNLRDGSFRQFRRHNQIVFQDPNSSLNPRMTVERLIGEPLLLDRSINERKRAEMVLSALDDVGLGEQYRHRYPHELSGGQRQRVGIARALIRKPSFVIADEPVSALDVTVQAQVLAMFRALQEKQAFSCLFITHDIAVVDQIADRVAVMHQGKIVEQGPKHEVIDEPKSDYTKSLIEASYVVASNSG
jgi:peptide/nickel transport system ATP-binding protein